MPTTTYSGLSQRTQKYAEAKALAHAEPVIAISRYGLAKQMPKNKADTISFRRPIPFGSVHSAPLTEGVTPTSKQMQYEDVDVPLLQYGDVVEITDKVEDLAEDPVLNDASMLCGEQSAETMEMVVWGALKGGTNVFYANGSARNQVNTPASLGLQRKITRFIKRNRGKFITSRVSSSVKYGTEQIAPAYLAFAHSDCENDIRDMAGFVPAEKYGSEKPLPYEIGKVEDVRYILSPLLDPFLGAGSTTLNGMTSQGGTAVDVYPIIYVAKDAYGHVALKGAKGISLNVIPADKPDKSDPLGQRGYVSWKTYYAAAILNENWCARAEVGVTAL